MNFDKNKWTSFGSTSLFVLLWSSGAFFSRLGLQHASAFAFLTLRFALAFGVLLTLAACRGRWLPEPGTRWRVALTGLLLLGSYAICYLLALDHGITPGVLATLLGVQPVLTLVLMERRFSVQRLLGLFLALAGLVLVVCQSIGLARFSVAGMAFALGALVCMTLGAILQKQVKQAPLDVLPLQYAVSLLLCVAVLPFQPFEIHFTAGLLVSWLWLGLVISLGAQLLFYRLIQTGNLVNVTSLFYLVPAMTAVLDYLLLGNRMSLLTVTGMGAILLGIMVVFRQR